ncbi:MAG: hypothetical protein F6J97_02000 [Leptolyngbya sp. SIO4C1]|nr:hypothetical protein [Leptolyngbya sp. SIO4C1]
MQLHFVTLSVPLLTSPAALRQAVESTLQEQGEPLRWAITAVDVAAQQVQVEAVVTVQAAK